MRAGLDKVDVKTFRSALVTGGALDLKLFPVDNAASLQQLIMYETHSLNHIIAFSLSLSLFSDCSFRCSLFACELLVQS
jgi:hypothetical protein